jgi:glycosyltransferase involved in cell wall biosynthesis
MNIIVTGPSLDTKYNISGIASVVNNILDETNLNYFHLVVGKTDQQKRNIVWLYDQFVLPIKLIWRLFTSKTEIVHINAPFEKLAVFRDFILLKISKLMGVKVLLHIHGGHYLNNLPKKGLFFKFLKYYVKSSDYIIVLSKMEKDLLVLKFKINKENITPLENCVRIPERFYKKKNKKVEIIFLGRIENDKGIFDIVKALSQLIKIRSDFIFKLYGTGSIEEEVIRELTNILGSNFQFMGIVSGKEKDKAFQKADIFLLPSYYEGLPLSLLEAMSFGVVPIVTDVGSIGTVVKNKFNGYIVEMKNSIELCNIINNVIENYKNNSMDDMKNNTIQTISENYNCKDYGVKLEKIYKKLLSVS